MRYPIALALVLTTASAVNAQSRDLQTIWIVQPGVVPAGERDLAGGEFVIKQRLLPTGLAQLEGDVAAKGAFIPSGTQLIQVRSPDVKVYCPAEVAQQKLIGHAHVCLIDSDGDNQFDSLFKTTSQTKGLLVVAGNRPKNPEPIIAVPYRTLEPAAMRDEYFVAIERRNYFNIYGRESFMIAFGREGALERLTSPLSFKSSELPKTMTIMGAQFEALSETDGKLKVRVLTAMPPQPFGIVKTTTYRFY